jgi:hypothetical protein
VGEEEAKDAVTVAGVLLLLRAESFRAMAASNSFTPSTLAVEIRQTFNTNAGIQNLRLTCCE